MINFIKIMKILCLHGYGQHEESIKSTFSNIENFFNIEYAAKFDYIIAPHKVLNLKKQEGYGWFTFEDDKLETFFKSTKNHNIDNSIITIQNFIEENGPYDGIIGFSQ